MTAAQFYALSYYELTLILEGWAERRRRDLRERREESAWLASWLLLPHKKHDAEPVTPDQLMGRNPRKKRGQGKAFATPIEAFDAFFAAKSKQEVKANGQ